MKKFTLAICIGAVATLALSSCGKDDNPAPDQTNSEKLIGRWEGKYVGQDTSGNSILKENEKRYINYSIDGFYSAKFLSSGLIIDSTYYQGVSFHDTSSWSIYNDNMLRTVSGISIDTGMITMLDGSNLVIKSISGSPISWTGFTRF